MERGRLIRWGGGGRGQVYNDDGGWLVLLCWGGVNIFSLIKSCCCGNMQQNNKELKGRFTCITT